MGSLCSGMRGSRSPISSTGSSRLDRQQHWFSKQSCPNNVHLSSMVHCLKRLDILRSEAKSRQIPAMIPPQAVIVTEQQVPSTSSDMTLKGPGLFVCVPPVLYSTLFILSQPRCTVSTGNTAPSGCTKFQVPYESWLTSSTTLHVVYFNTKS